MFFFSSSPLQLSSSQPPSVKKENNRLQFNLIFLSIFIFYFRTLGLG